MKDDSGRLFSIDALRGFDMFFIVGGAALVSALCAAFGCQDGWLAGQMRHVKWAGLAHHDTIFPLFLFLAGVSWPFSLASQIAKGRGVWRIRGRVLKRTAVLFIIGLSFGGILKFNPCFRLMSVLGFIGLCWGIAALLFMQIRRMPVRVLLLAALLVGYWVLLAFFADPLAPAGADTYSMKWNVVSYLDRMVYPNHMLFRNELEPESLFSVTNGVALAFAGMCMGALLGSESMAKTRKAALLALSAAVFLAAGAFFDFVLGDPVIKKLWTTSFVLYTSAYSAALLAVFYWIVDVKGFRAWTYPLRVIGMNSITIYLFMMLGIQKMLSGFLFDGLSGWVGAPWAKAVTAVGNLFVAWMFVHFLYKRKVFLRV